MKLFSTLRRGWSNLNEYCTHGAGFTIVVIMVVSLGLGCGGLYGMWRHSLEQTARITEAYVQVTGELQQSEQRNTKLQTENKHLQEELQNALMTVKALRTEATTAVPVHVALSTVNWMSVAVWSSILVGAFTTMWFTAPRLSRRPAS